MSVSNCSSWQTTTAEPGFSARAADTSDTALTLSRLSAVLIFQAFRPPRWHRQSLNPPQHASEQAPREMALRQQKPVVTGMLYQPPAGLHQPLLQAGQRPRSDSLRQHEPPPQVAQVVCDHAEPQPNFVGPESMAAQPRHFHRLLPLFDPLLGRPSLVVEPYHRPVRRLQIGHDEPDAREQLPGMMLDLRYHSPCRRPTGCLVEKALVPHDRFVTGTPHRARQQF